MLGAEVGRNWFADLSRADATRMHSCGHDHCQVSNNTWIGGRSQELHDAHTAAGGVEEDSAAPILPQAGPARKEVRKVKVEKKKMPCSTALAGKILLLEYGGQHIRIRLIILRID